MLWLSYAKKPFLLQEGGADAEAATEALAIGEADLLSLQLERGIDEAELAVRHARAAGRPWLTGIETWPTDANFLLARAGSGTYEALLHEGVIVRPLQGFGMADCVRITIGTPAENERVVKTLRKQSEASP